jgi:hypothetical protein
MRRGPLCGSLCFGSLLRDARGACRPVGPYYRGRPAPRFCLSRHEEQARRRHLEPLWTRSESMKVLVTGAGGLISGYLVPELLSNGHSVVGIDNFSKYGPVQKFYNNHPNYSFIEGDARDTQLLWKHARGCHQIVAAAAKVGGIAYFHEYAYDLLAENERIAAATFDAALRAHREGSLERIIVVSSSLVFECTQIFPTHEDEQFRSPPPRSTYGFQNSPTSTSQRVPSNSTSCHTRSCGRSTVSASAKDAPRGAGKSLPET